MYCIIREVEDGYWGGFGTIIRMEDIVAIGMPESGTHPSPPRCARPRPRCWNGSR